MLAIVPVRGRDGKRRLDGFLSAGERARLVEAMLADVVSACEAAEEVHETLVVTPDRAVVAAGVEILVDEGAGHPEAIARALAHPRAGRGALVVMGDCPLARPESLDRLVRAARPVALVRSRSGGANALALRSPDVLAPAFGIPNGDELTLERARAAGHEPEVLDDASLAFDVDYPADVWELREQGQGTRACAAVADMLPATGGLR